MKWPNLKEASTKRAIVWIIGGCFILFQAFRGKPIDADAVFSKLDIWLGIIMSVAGALGLLPDEKNSDLPWPDAGANGLRDSAMPAERLHEIDGKGFGDK